MRQFRLKQRGAFWSNLAVIAVVVAFALVNARWIWLFRHAQPLDVDESGYLSIALIDLHALQTGGLTRWLHAVEAPSIQAPLTTSITSLLFSLTGPHVIAGFAVPLFFGCITIAATYWLARTLMTPAAALAATALVASCPVIVNYSRSYSFAITAAAVMTVALLALVRSNRFTLVGWASLFGVSVGLLPLARTMTIAFVPGIVLGAAIHTLAGSAHRGRRLVNLCWALVVGGGTAATWLAFNGRLVFDYLTRFGYGSRATEYGPPQSFLGLDAWLNTLHNLAGNIYLPHGLVLIAGTVALPILLAARLWQASTVGLLDAASKSPALPLAILVSGALVALTTSQNKGTGFIAPIVPAMLVLAVWALVRLADHRVFRYLLGACCVAVCGAATGPLLDARTAVARPWIVMLPKFGPAIVTDGRGPIHIYEGYGFGDGSSALPLAEAEGKAWLRLSDVTATTLQRENASGAPIAFGFRHLLYNANTVRLLLLLEGKDAALPAVQSAETADSFDGYLNWLTKGGAATACLLLTWSGHQGEILPPVANAAMEEAAQRAGFLPLGRWPTPSADGITLWRRQGPSARCPAP